MAKTNVQYLAHKVEIDFEWELLTVISENKSTDIDDNLSLPLQQGANVTIAETVRWGWYEATSSVLPLS